MANLAAFLAYFNVKQHWITYQQQLQLLNEQITSRLETLDDTLYQQIQTLTQVPAVPVPSVFFAVHLRVVNAEVTHLLRQHQTNRTWLRAHQQAEQTALYEKLQQACEADLGRILSALIIYALMPPPPPLPVNFDPFG